MKYLFENKAPIDETAIYWASNNNKQEVVDYLFFNGAPYFTSGHVPDFKYFKSSLYKYQNIYKELLNSLIIDDVAYIIVSYLV